MSNGKKVLFPYACFDNKMTTQVGDKLPSEYEMGKTGGNPYHRHR